ncbi:MAG: ADP-ribosylglycohydrolase family protein [Methanobrevibacter sp.]|nr:ADP-ribosylglycohydrolase family protein [Methanobrevibacter sp.]
MNYNNKIKAILFGLAIGDALGVPVEFESREYLKENPVDGMIGFGTYNKPPGTFSDDSSLTFALVESLIIAYDLEDIAQNMVKWIDEGFWTADGVAFDIGNTTQIAIYDIKTGVSPLLSGESNERSNGNGSLMRIAPLLFILMNKPIDERFQMTKEVSSITHAHLRSVIACFYFLEFLRHLLLDDLDKYEIYHKLQKDIPEFFDNYFKENDLVKENNYEQYLEEIKYFNRLLKENIYKLDKDDINSSGYVIDTIEASIWCLLTTNNYSDAVLKAVNLGGDTDTTACVTGALAGLLYGFDDIPKEWVENLAKSEDIEDLAIRFADNLE